MQKWEYAVIMFIRGKTAPYWSSHVICSINGKDVGAKKVKGSGSQYWEGEQLYDYLNRAGKEGWRLAGVGESHLIFLEREIS